MQSENPFYPILEQIAKHGINEAPIPIAAALEGDRWTVDVDVRINGRHWDVSCISDTLADATRRALWTLKRELPR